MTNSITIVGGGTAGWMTAVYLAYQLPNSTKITLIESENIGIIGVGEGSTPYLKSFFDSLNISEEEWMMATDATYKSGIRFDDWCGDARYPSYFHPFFNEFDQRPAEMFFHNSGLKRRGFDADANPDHYFTAAYVADKFRKPLPSSQTKKFVDYAYHFDSVKLANFLQNKAVAKGVEHVVADVEKVIPDEHNQIRQVNTTCGRVLYADFFVDCTGFAGLLLQKAQGQDFESYQDWLFNDSAVAVQTPADANHKYKTQTRSKGLSCGWMWQIPLTTRWGNGYVYSSKYLGKEEAKNELLKELGIPAESDVKVRHLSMKVGKVKNHWYKNCVAIGLSQGFIEPLEATALMLVQFAIQNLTQVLQKGEYSENDVNHYNSEINRLFEGVRDYVSLHYILNTRTDSQYWIDAREKTRVSTRLQHLLAAWDEGKDFEQALTDIQQQLVYLRPSWYCILSGMGRHPDALQPTDKAGASSMAIEYCQNIVNQHFATSV